MPEEIKKTETTTVTPPPTVEPTGDELLRKVREDAKAVEPPQTPPPTTVASETTVAEPQESEEERTARVKDRISRLIAKPVSAVKADPVATGTSVGQGIEENPEELIANGNHLRAMEIISERAARKERERVMQEMTQNEQSQQYINTWNKANATVWEKHPEILDVDEGAKKADEVPFYKEMSAVWKEHPEFFYLPNGPILAMELAEARHYRSQDIKKAKVDAAKQENERQTSVQSSSMLSSAGGSGRPENSQPVNLSNDEQLVSRKLGLSDTEFARYKKRGSVLGPDYYKKYQGPIQRKA